MEFTREIQRLLTGILLVLAAICLLVVYWAVIGPDTILLRDDNARLFQARAATIRGQLVDRQGAVLAQSIREQSQSATRREYLYPEMNSALGYYSLRYGEGGIETAFNAILSGDNLERDLLTYFHEDILHLPRRGADVQLTLDLETQRQIVAAFGDHRGAAVVLSVPDGEVLAMVSLPTYDPNTLDADWETLVTSPGNPFFNRAVQGSYQPGSSIHTILMTAALLSGIPLDTEYENATEPVIVGEVKLECALMPLVETLTLAEAYRFGCPAPFAQLVDQLGLEQIQSTFDLFQLDAPVALPGLNNIAEIPTTRLSGPIDVKEALGQGDVTVTPLKMAAITAAIINAGNAPQPYTLLATRSPSEDAWTPAQVVRPSLPITTVTISRRLQGIMREAASSGTARPASREDINIGGQAALAYSGDEILTWFTGFARTGERAGAAVAIVLEGSDDLVTASTIGGIALEAAVAALAASAP
jgi:penicillin-binding protein A